MPYSLPNYNNTEIDQILIYESQQVPILFPLLLFFIFVVFAGATYGYQSKKNGRGNLPLSLASAGFIVSILGFILFLIDGIINLETLAITVTLTIIFAFWALFTSE